MELWSRDSRLALLKFGGCGFQGVGFRVTWIQDLGLRAVNLAS